MHVLKSSLRSAAVFGAIAAVSAAPAVAQSRFVLPAGTVIIVRTTTALESATAQVGQRFETTVEQNLNVDDYSVLPSGSRISGTVTMSRAATRSQSGVIDVHFDRLILSDGSMVPIAGHLTSTDSAERRQINADPNAHVVLVGARAGIGAAIAGAGSSQNSNNILSALGSLLSEGRDVAVPAGTPLAVELERAVTLRARGRVTGGDEAFTLYTAADRIRAAQQALAQRNYYRGTPTGVLDNATRRALFSFQVDNGLTGTGNLDGRTARMLGVTPATLTGAVMTADQATFVRRDAEALLTRYRGTIGIGTTGRATLSRSYSAAELEALFALSAFADNASLYEQIVRAGANAEASARAGRALVLAARRVDAAMNGTDVAISDARGAWSTLRQRLAAVEAANPGT